MGNFKVYTTFNKSQAAPSAWRCPKTQFWGPLTNWEFEPSPRPPTHSDPIINKHTEQVKKLWIYHGMHWPPCYILTQWNARIGYPGFPKKKFQTHPPKPAKVIPFSAKVSLHPAKLRMFFPTHPWGESFGNESTPSDGPWIEAYCPKF